MKPNLSNTELLECTLVECFLICVVVVELKKDDGGGVRAGSDIDKDVWTSLCFGVPGSDSQMKGTVARAPAWYHSGTDEELVSMTSFRVKQPDMNLSSLKFWMDFTEIPSVVVSISSAMRFDRLISQF